MSDKFRGINQIEVDRYKSIHNLTVDLKAVTVLAGCNSSGKSSIMQPLLLMKQTLDIDSKATLLLQSENVNLTSFEQIKTRIPSSASDTFSLRVQAGNFSSQSTFTGTEEEISLVSTCYYFLDKVSGDKNRQLELSDKTSIEELRGWVQQVYNGLDHVENVRPHVGACFHGIYVQQPEGKDAAISSILRPSDFL